MDSTVKDFVYFSALGPGAIYKKMKTSLKAGIFLCSVVVNDSGGGSLILSSHTSSCLKIHFLVDNEL